MERHPVAGELVGNAADPWYSGIMFLFVRQLGLKRHLFAIAIMIGWFELVLLSGRQPQLSVQLERVTVKFLKIMRFYILLLQLSVQLEMIRRVTVNILEDHEMLHSSAAAVGPTGGDQKSHCNILEDHEMLHPSAAAVGPTGDDQKSHCNILEDYEMLHPPAAVVGPTGDDKKSHC